MASSPPGDDICDYIVVGSGPGGGTVAARLAEAGWHVVLLEAGGDPRELVGGDALVPDGNRLPDDYDVPGFHPFASENDALSWHFFVHHYPELAQRKRDTTAYRDEWDGRPVDGVLYPRSSCLGGCSAHNALIFIAPSDADWDDLAQSTGDKSWCAARMAHYFARIERCRHRWLAALLAMIGIGKTGHGWRGWLQTEKALPREALDDGELVSAMANSALAALGHKGGWWQRLKVLVRSFGDPNDRSVLASAAEGLFYTPLSTRRHTRNGTRERLRDVADRYPDHLDIRLNCLATRVLLDEHNRAIGVEYRAGANQYRVHRHPQTQYEVRQVRARREVILSGGAFNTPQLLMLSGIGPADELGRLDIELRVDLPGVGRNLQDRYEIGVVNRIDAPTWPSLRDASFEHGDKPWRQWKHWGLGMYSSNGAALCVAAKSDQAEDGLPDLFVMSLLAPFKGYFPGYSRAIAEHRNCLTWAVLKAHTRNRAGRVTLNSTDPTEPPLIDFRYFDPTDDPEEKDLKAVVEGIHRARQLAEPLFKCGILAAEEVPGPAVQTDAQLQQYVRDHAWGHHACGTCAIGPREQGDVLASDLRVHGTSGLRVVDASIFPRIPGYFIASAIYMAAEKAADVIIADAMN
jgi:choline dehydrogenase-like flavoprotein